MPLQRHQAGSDDLLLCWQADQHSMSPARVAEHFQHDSRGNAMINVEGSYSRTRLATLRTRLGQFQDCAASLWRVRLEAKAWLSGRNGRSSNLQQRLRCFQGSGESSVLFPCVSCLLACLSLTCLDAVSRFSFAHTCSSSSAIFIIVGSPDVRAFAYYCTAA